MADPPPTFETLAAELQVMILSKVFEGTEITVKYPYQTLRNVEYDDMRLQGDLRIFFVSKQFYDAAKTALFQTATFYHQEFYFGKGRRKSRRLQDAGPEAFRLFRHISGSRLFTHQFLNACRVNIWPYEDLRSVTVVLFTYSRNANHQSTSGDGTHDLRDFFDLRNALTTRGVKLRCLLTASVSEIDKSLGYSRMRDYIIRFLIEDDCCLVEEAQKTPQKLYSHMITYLKDVFKCHTVIPMLIADHDDYVQYADAQMLWQ